MCKLLGLGTFLLLGAFLPAGAQEARTYPAQVLIIRHAEKPAGDSPDLSPRGKERARALYNLFRSSKARPRSFPTPDFIFATRDSGKSHRPRETVTPLASRLETKIDDRYANADFELLAKELLSNPKYEGKVVLICWHHGKAQDLAAKLGAVAPKHWKDSVFDRVWRIDYDREGKARFRDLPQQLLPGDSER